MIDPVLVLFVAAGLAIAFMTAVAIYAPDRAAERALRRRRAAPTRKPLVVKDRKALPPLFSVLSLFLSMLVVGMNAWFYLRPYVHEPWDWGEALAYFFLAIIVSFTALPVAIILGGIGTARRSSTFSWFAFACPIATLFVYTLWLGVLLLFFTDV